MRSHTVKKERAMQLVTLDPHGPNELRCNGTLRNVAEFLQVNTIILHVPIDTYTNAVYASLSLLS